MSEFVVYYKVALSFTAPKYKSRWLNRAVASGGAGGAAPPPTRDFPPPTFTGLISEGKLEHYGINT